MTLHVVVCAMATVIEVQFYCGLRGYHIYKAIWSPRNHELLVAKQETNNPHDQYAIAAYKQESVVGHLPKEISRFTWFIIRHGAAVTVKVVDVRQRRSPLIRGGLEIPVEVTVSMPFLDSNKQALEEYRKLVDIHYEEPIDGNFRDYTADILRAIDNTDSSESETDQEEDAKQQQ